MTNCEICGAETNCEIRDGNIICQPCIKDIIYGAKSGIDVVVSLLKRIKELRAKLSDTEYDLFVCRGIIEYKEENND